MKVLYLIDTLAVGGTEKSLLEISQRFKETSPIVCHIYQGETLRPAFEAVEIPVISLNLPGKYQFFQASRQLLKIIQSFRPDVVHTALFRADIVGRVAGRLANVPVINSFVSEPYNARRWRSLSSAGRVKLRIFQELDRLTAGWVHHFMAVSESAKAANCQALGIRQEKVTVINRGRDPTPFLKALSKHAGTSQSIAKLPGNAPILLNVARILRLKGQMELVRAMPRVCQAYPSSRLLIAGDGPDHSQLRMLIQELDLGDNVHLLGTRNDIPHLLAMADLFLFPSHYEGYPGALIEAMFAARPIVATDIPVHRETITHSETGFLIPVENPAAIADGIIWMLQHRSEAEQMGTRAQAVALERFQIEQIAAQHEEMYVSVHTHWTRQ